MEKAMRVELILLVRKSPEFDEKLKLIGPGDWNERDGTDFLESRLPTFHTRRSLLHDHRGALDVRR